MDIWIAWQLDEVGRKRPRAPWQTDHCYPVQWGASADERPETDFETVKSYADLKPYELDALGLEFEDGVEEQSLNVGLILPHDPPDPPVMQIDLDDVRRPQSGEIHPKARDIVQRPESYASVSTSGEGVHCMVRASLPDGYGKFIAPLDDEPWVGGSEPQVEMYDHGRHVALTGNHLDATPAQMNEAQETMDWIVEEYEPTHGGKKSGDGSDGDFDPAEEYVSERRRSAGQNANKMSDYFTESLTGFARPKANESTSTQGPQGAHPAHGGTSSADSESSNYHIDTSQNVWHCFAHESGGGPLTMVAVLEGELDCRDCARSDPLDTLTDREYLRVCLAARDRHGFRGDPPYRAVRGAAKELGLVLADDDDGIIGESAYKIGRQVYDNMDLEELR